MAKTPTDIRTITEINDIADREAAKRAPDPEKMPDLSRAKKLREELSNLRDNKTYWEGEIPIIEEFLKKHQDRLKRFQDDIAAAAIRIKEIEKQLEVVDELEKKDILARIAELTAELELRQK